jgi:hypothetical protein
MGWSNAEKFQFLPAYLTGTARKWYEHILDKKYSTTPPSDYNTLRVALVKDYCLSDYRDCLSRKLKKIEQRPEQSVTDFILEVKNLCLKIEEKMPEPIIVSLIRGGLLPSIAKRVARDNPLTISKLLESARSAETGNNLKTKEREEPKESLMMSL